MSVMVSCRWWEMEDDKKEVKTGVGVDASRKPKALRNTGRRT